MLNWPALIVFFCAYAVAVLICGAYQGPMPDGYRWLMLALACICLGGFAVFVISLKPKGGRNEDQ